MLVTEWRMAGFGLALFLSVGVCAGSAEGGTSGETKLANAVKESDIVALRDLLAQDVDVNARNPNGATALHWAVFRDDMVMASLLVGAGAVTDLGDDLGVTPLTLACQNGSAEMVHMLLGAGANPNAALSTGETPLMTCARTGNVDGVADLLEHGADTSVKGEWHGQTALMWAASERHSGVTRVLIEHGADINTRAAVRVRQLVVPSACGKLKSPCSGKYGGLADEKHGGFTALMFAARSGDLESVQLLLANGANVNETAADGHSPLLISTVRGHVALATFLLQQGADPNLANAGYTPLHWIAGAWDSDLTAPGQQIDRDPEWKWLRGLAGRKEELARTLLAHGADVNARLTKPPPVPGQSGGASAFRFFLGATPFLLTAQSLDFNLMRLFHAGGARTDLATSANSTALMLAGGVGRHNEKSVLVDRQLEIVRFLLDLGADVNAVNDDGETTLHGAAFTGSDAVIELLVARDAIVNPRNKNGATPFQHAIAKGYVKGRERTAELLRRLGGVTDSNCVHINAYDTVCPGPGEPGESNKSREEQGPVSVR